MAFRRILVLLACGSLSATEAGKVLDRFKKKDTKIADVGVEKGSTMHFLGLMIRVKDVTELASKLKHSGLMDQSAGADLDLELKDVEREIQEAEGHDHDKGTARDIMSMVSVVRGTVMQYSSGLTDEEVEARGDSWTYANPRYWDDYYKKTSNEEKFDWYGSWDDKVTALEGNWPAGASMMGDLLKTFINKDHNILMFGCGNSDMSEKMYERGYENIVNIDISQSLLDGLKERLAPTMPKMQWLAMSGAEMTFADGEFDIVLDKGTFDAIEQNSKLLAGSIKDVYRVLKPRGYLVSVTYNDVDIRVEKHLRKQAAWGECRHYSFERSGHTKRKGFHVHICQKANDEL